MVQVRPRWQHRAQWATTVILKEYRLSCKGDRWMCRKGTDVYHPRKGGLVNLELTYNLDCWSVSAVLDGNLGLYITALPGGSAECPWGSGQRWCLFEILGACSSETRRRNPQWGEDYEQWSLWDPILLASLPVILPCFMWVEDMRLLGQRQRTVCYLQQ